MGQPPPTPHNPSPKRESRCNGKADVDPKYLGQARQRAAPPAAEAGPTPQDKKKRGGDPPIRLGVPLTPPKKKKKKKKTKCPSSRSRSFPWTCYSFRFEPFSFFAPVGGYLFLRQTLISEAQYPGPQAASNTMEEEARMRSIMPRLLCVPLLKSSTFSGLRENPLVGKKLKS